MEDKGWGGKRMKDGIYSINHDFEVEGRKQKKNGDWII